VDTLTAKQRSKRMSMVRCKNTEPEKAVRRIASALGHKYRLHLRDLPGAPDLVFVSKRKVVFVHGCFWHQHKCAAGNRIPKSRINFWRTKLEGNVLRDNRILSKLRRDGWRVLVIWECQIRDETKTAARLKRFLEGENG
jgi:DNA mismatch endonuclease (patch repair protein)